MISLKTMRASRCLEALGFQFRRLTVVFFGLVFRTIAGRLGLLRRIISTLHQATTDQLVTVSGINMVVPHGPGDMLRQPSGYASLTDVASNQPGHSR